MCADTDKKEQMDKRIVSLSTKFRQCCIGVYRQTIFAPTLSLRHFLSTPGLVQAVRVTKKGISSPPPAVSLSSRCINCILSPPSIECTARPPEGQKGGKKEPATIGRSQIRIPPVAGIWKSGVGESRFFFNIFNQDFL